MFTQVIESINEIPTVIENFASRKQINSYIINKQSKEYQRNTPYNIFHEMFFTKVQKITLMSNEDTYTMEIYHNYNGTITIDAISKKEQKKWKEIEQKAKAFAKTL